VVGSFIGKIALIVLNIRNFMSHFPDKLGTICQTINDVADSVDSMTGMLPSGLMEKVESYIGRGITSNIFGNPIDQIDRNIGGGRNNQSRGEHINRAAHN
jgi:hypothetical protein